MKKKKVHIQKNSSRIRQKVHTEKNPSKIKKKIKLLQNTKLSSTILVQNSKSQIDAKITRQQTLISILNPLITIFAGIILVTTWQKVQPTHIDQARSLFSRIISWLSVVWIIKSYTTRVIMKIDQDKDPLHHINLTQILLLRTGLSILFLAISFYPAFILNHFVETFQEMIHNYLPNIKQKVLTTLTNIATLIVSGLSGAITNIVLGMLSAFFYDQSKSIFLFLRNKSNQKNQKK